ncbi:hypothetical protein [Paenibacillus xylanexedens]|uniref:hypothetical protein n=1 Tax=Paenibacillus xylanexedens TaxID=528191 RepID=UPI0028ED28BE|nr:hypothetical protein [Paenibacillus xylanexedens]
MQTHKLYFTDFEDAVSQFIGLPVIFDYNEQGELLNVIIGGDEKELHDTNKKNIEGISSSVKTVLINFYDSHKNLKFRPIFKQLITEELAYSFIDRSYPEIDEQFSYFIENLKKLCIKTYESESTEMGFIIFKDAAIDVHEFLDKRDLKYTPLSSPRDLEYFIEDKQTLKIVDSKSVSFVINFEYKVIGFVQKTKSKQSIIDIMMDRHKFIEERDIKVMSHDYYVATQIPDYSSISESLTKLRELKEEVVNELKKEYKINNDETDIRRITEYIKKQSLSEEQDIQLIKQLKVLLSLLDKENKILTEQNELFTKEGTATLYLIDLLKEKVQDQQNEKELKNVDFVYFKNKQINWSSSYEYIISYMNGRWKLRNYFVLRSILTRFVMSQYSLSNISYIIEKMNYSIPRVLDLYNLVKRLSEKNIGSLICILRRSQQKNNTIFKTMLQDGKMSTEKYRAIVQTENGHPINIRSCDPYLFELVASIDGAIILDYKLNILSFAEMIGSRPNASGGLYRGARTLAALSASYYALGVKISEDGDMQLFENEREIARI